MSTLFPTRRGYSFITDAFENGDAAALAALYTEDAVLVTQDGSSFGRQSIEKHYADLFQKFHFSNLLTDRSGFPSRYRDGWQ